MAEEKNLDDVVLYHGTLEELNRRNPPERQYEFVPDVYSFITHSDPESFKSKVLERGFDGLVNRKTSLSYIGDAYHSESRYLLEGTPIMLVKIPVTKKRKKIITHHNY